MRRFSLIPQVPGELGQEKPLLVSRGRKSASITLFISFDRVVFFGFPNWSATSQTMLRAIRGLTRLTGWTEQTRAEPPHVTRANRVFEDAKAHDSLYSYVEFFRCFRGPIARQPTDPFSARVRATQQGAI